MSPAPLKRIICCLALTLCLVGLSPRRCAAWGGTAHRIIAWIARTRLENERQRGSRPGASEQEKQEADRAKRALDEITRRLPNEDLVAASTYADDVRAYRPETTRWHLVEIPLNSRAYVPRRDCVQTAQGDCIIAALARFQKVLPDPTGDKTEALMFLVHLVGDLHQPLHCADDNDRGGNGLRVEFGKKKTSLHAFWDADIVERALRESRRSEGEYAKLLLDGVNDPNSQTFSEAASWTPETFEGQRTFEVWAIDSVKVAANNVYPPKKPKPNARASYLVLGEKYYTDNKRIMEKQLLKAGIRLAYVLKETLGRNNPGGD